MGGGGSRRGRERNQLPFPQYQLMLKNGNISNGKSKNWKNGWQKDKLVRVCSEREFDQIAGDYFDEPRIIDTIFDFIFHYRMPQGQYGCGDVMRKLDYQPVMGKKRMMYDLVRGLNKTRSPKWNLQAMLKKWPVDFESVYRCTGEIESEDNFQQF